MIFSNHAHSKLSIPHTTAEWDNNFVPRCRQITMPFPVPDHSVFTGRMPFLPPNQQRQSTEGTNVM